MPVMDPNKKRPKITQSDIDTMNKGLAKSFGKKEEKPKSKDKKSKK